MVRLVIIRRDVRLVDNTSLREAAKNNSDEDIAVVFFRDPRQVEPHPYKSLPGLGFLGSSLRELDQELRKKGSQLFMVEDHAERALERLLRANNISSVFVHRDFTPFSCERDKQLKRVCQKHNVSFTLVNDILLFPPESVLKSDGSPYTVFTPFFRKTQTLTPNKPQPIPPVSFASSLAGAQDVLERFPTHPLASRSKGVALLKSIPQPQTYSENRDFPAVSATSNLSAHLKFGTLSVREVFWSVVERFGDHPILRQLVWRDFFTHIAHHYPRVFKGSFHQVYNHIVWENNEEWFSRWKAGTTGFPLVDAGMRELQKTGSMHNRVRMVTASFLVKDLHIDWREGEKYFAQSLVDYDPCVNNGNWQWVASTGCDAQPYFRVFNPWRQQVRFDPDCKYIKKWVPELANYSSKEIHQWSGCNEYPSPVVDHAVQAQKSKAMYSLVKK